MDQTAFLVSKIEELDLYLVQKKLPKYIVWPESEEFPEYRFLTELADELGLDMVSTQALTQKNRLLMRNLMIDLGRTGTVQDWIGHAGERLNPISRDFFGFSI